MLSPRFFLHGFLIPNLNANIIVLICKVPGACTMKDFCLIALANFQFKIVRKILADRLVVICMRIISPQQRGFVRDCHISSCVILALEAINLLTKKQYGGNIAMKVDIRKTFVTLDWNFLLFVLKSFGFETCFCEWIFAILHSTRLSILVNGNGIGFSLARGVYDRETLSPPFFLSCR